MTVGLNQQPFTSSLKEPKKAVVSKNSNENTRVLSNVTRLIAHRHAYDHAHNLNSPLSHIGMVISEKKQSVGMFINAGSYKDNSAATASAQTLSGYIALSIYSLPVAFHESAVQKVHALGSVCLKDKRLAPIKSTILLPFDEANGIVISSAARDAILKGELDRPFKITLSDKSTGQYLCNASHQQCQDIGIIASTLSAATAATSAAEGKEPSGPTAVADGKKLYGAAATAEGKEPSGPTAAAEGKEPYGATAAAVGKEPYGATADDSMAHEEENCASLDKGSTIGSTVERSFKPRSIDELVISKIECLDYQCLGHFASCLEYVLFTSKHPVGYRTSRRSVDLMPELFEAYEHTNQTTVADQTRFIERVLSVDPFKDLANIFDSPLQYFTEISYLLDNLPSCERIATVKRIIEQCLSLENLRSDFITGYSDHLCMELGDIDQYEYLYKYPQLYYRKAIIEQSQGQRMCDFYLRIHSEICNYFMPQTHASALALKRHMKLLKQTDYAPFDNTSFNADDESIKAYIDVNTLLATQMSSDYVRQCSQRIKRSNSTAAATAVDTDATHCVADTALDTEASHCAAATAVDTDATHCVAARSGGIVHSERDNELKVRARIFINPNGIGKSVISPLCAPDLMDDEHCIKVLTSSSVIGLEYLQCHYASYLCYQKENQFRGIELLTYCLLSGISCSHLLHLLITLAVNDAYLLMKGIINDTFQEDLGKVHNPIYSLCLLQVLTHNGFSLMGSRLRLLNYLFRDAYKDINTPINPYYAYTRHQCLMSMLHCNDQAHKQASSAADSSTNADATTASSASSAADSSSNTDATTASSASAASVGAANVGAGVAARDEAVVRTGYFDLNDYGQVSFNHNFGGSPDRLYKVYDASKFSDDTLEQLKRALEADDLFALTLANTPTTSFDNNGNPILRHMSGSVTLSEFNRNRRERLSNVAKYYIARELHRLQSLQALQKMGYQCDLKDYQIFEYCLGENDQYEKLENKALIVSRELIARLYSFTGDLRFLLPLPDNICSNVIKKALELKLHRPDLYELNAFNLLSHYAAGLEAFKFSNAIEYAYQRRLKAEQRQIDGTKPTLLEIEQLSCIMQLSIKRRNAYILRNCRDIASELLRVYQNYPGSYASALSIVAKFMQFDGAAMRYLITLFGTKMLLLPHNFDDLRELFSSIKKRSQPSRQELNLDLDLKHKALISAQTKDSYSDTWQFHCDYRISLPKDGISYVMVRSLDRLCRALVSDFRYGQGIFQKELANSTIACNCALLFNNLSWLETLFDNTLSYNKRSLRIRNNILAHFPLGCDDLRDKLSGFMIASLMISINSKRFVRLLNSDNILDYLKTLCYHYGQKPQLLPKLPRRIKHSAIANDIDPEQIKARLAPALQWHSQTNSAQDSVASNTDDPPEMTNATAEYESSSSGKVAIASGAPSNDVNTPSEQGAPSKDISTQSEPNDEYTVAHNEIKSTESSAEDILVSSSEDIAHALSYSGMNSDPFFNIEDPFELDLSFSTTSSSSLTLASDLSNPLNQVQDNSENSSSFLHLKPPAWLEAQTPFISNDDASTHSDAVYNTPSQSSAAAKASPLDAQEVGSATTQVTERSTNVYVKGDDKSAAKSAIDSKSDAATNVVAAAHTLEAATSDAVAEPIDAATSAADEETVDSSSSAAVAKAVDVATSDAVAEAVDDGLASSVQDEKVYEDCDLDWAAVANAYDFGEKSEEYCELEDAALFEKLLPKYGPLRYRHAILLTLLGFADMLKSAYNRTIFCTYEDLQRNCALFYTYMLSEQLSYLYSMLHDNLKVSDKTKNEPVIKVIGTKHDLDAKEDETDVGEYALSDDDNEGAKGSDLDSDDEQITATPEDEQFKAALKDAMLKTFKHISHSMTTTQRISFYSLTEQEEELEALIRANDDLEEVFKHLLPQQITTIIKLSSHL